MNPKKHPKLLLSILLSSVLCAPALTFGGEQATESQVKNTVKQQSAQRPKWGMNMKQVRKKYGKPASVRKSKGKVKKLWPRITVWNYGSYSVYFERRIVLHTVVH